MEWPQLRKENSSEKPKKEEDFKGRTEALTKVSLFTPSTASKKETFQRVLRLSRARKSDEARLAAIATGLAPKGEIVFFKADTSRPNKDDIRGRIVLGEGEEAADVDCIHLEHKEDVQKSKFRVCYCTDYGVHVADLAYAEKDGPLIPQCILNTPQLDTVKSNKARPKFRCVRFITPQILLALQNKPNGAGAELLLMEISGAVTLRRKLHKKIKSATALSIAHLDASSPSEIDQHAIAVAGADTSITVLTLDRFVSAPKGRVKFRSHSFLPSVHPTSITSIAFSSYQPPTTNWNATPAQYLRLASTSIANTCVVHTLPLTPYPSPPKPNTPARYLLAPPTRSSLTQNTISTLVALFAIAVGAFFLQAFTEIRGGTPEYLGAKGWLSERVHGWIARPYMFEDGYRNAASSHFSEVISEASQTFETPIVAIKSAAAGTQETLGLRDLLAQRNMGSDTEDNANDGHEILVRDEVMSGDAHTTLSAELVKGEDIAEGKHQTKRWEELAQHEKEAWKKRLNDAGHWTAEEGEAVLKGVLFSGLANLAAGAAG